MKKKLLLVTILVLVGVLLTGCGKKEEKKEQSKTDAYKFAEEYNSLNGTKSSSGKIIRSLNIPKDNPFVYKTEDEIVKMIENKETFIVYFGFPTCPWCRSVLEGLVKAAKDKDVSTIYYVNVLDIRDVKEVNENKEVTTTKEGTKGYLKLIELLDNVLEDYTLTKEEETISAGEKRIYAPNVVAISNGKAIRLETGISEDLKDPYGELTDEMKEYSYNNFKCLIECLEEESTTCKTKMC